jgi:uncharacterized protein YegL
MTNPDYTHLALVVDRSGSMSPIASDMNGGIKQLLADQAKGPSTVKVDVCIFDTIAEFPYTDVAPDAITADLCVPRGMTALNDAIGMTINRLGNKFRTLSEDERPGNVIVAVITDGLENSSREYTAAQIKEMVTEQTEKWGWTFMYMAANVDAFATGGGYGFARGQTISYAPSAAGTQNVWEASSANILRTANGDNSGYLQSEREAASQE